MNYRFGERNPNLGLYGFHGVRGIPVVRGFTRRAESRFLSSADAVQNLRHFEQLYLRVRTQIKTYRRSREVNYPICECEPLFFSIYFCVGFERSGGVRHKIEFGLHAEIERRLALEQPSLLGCFFMIGWVLCHGVKIEFGLSNPSEREPTIIHSMPTFNANFNENIQTNIQFKHSMRTIWHATPATLLAE